LKRKLLITIAVAISIAICTSSVVAATNQNLQWGMSVGQRFDYNFIREVHNYNDTETWDLRFYNIVGDLPVISDNIDTWGKFPATPNRTCYLENGTQGTFPYIWYAIPIGNFDLIIDLWIGSGVNESEIVDTPLLVGYNCTSSWDGGNTTHIYAEIYSKSSGVLDTYQAVNQFETFSSSVEIVLIPGDDMLPVYIAVAGGVVLIVLVSVVLIKRR